MKLNAVQPAIDVRKARERYHTQTDWLESYHSFSFGRHYDPHNVGHGLLLVNNDDIVQPGKGFGMHPHQNMEVVTWVLEGELEHKDSTGNHGILYPGLAQRMSAGTGIWHSEMNPSATRPVRLVQMWVLPDEEGGKPGYEQKDINSELARGGWVAIASGKGHDSAVSIGQKGAVLWCGRLKAGESVKLPQNLHAHLYVARGAAQLGEDIPLEAGDAVRFTDALAPHLRASSVGAEILVWETE